MAETTIDRLSIEIESSSNNAAVQLDKLADALKNLKSSGNLNKAISTLTGISNALKTFATDSKVGENLKSVADGLKRFDGVKVSSTAAKSISDIGAALKGFDGSNADKLKDVAEGVRILSDVKVSATVGNGLSKIAEGITAFSSADTEKLMSTDFGSMADNLSKLNGVSGDGLNKMMTGLSQIGTVTRQLTPENIEKFGEGVARLVEKLEPLSERLKNVKGGLEEINKELKTTNKTASDNKSSLEKLAYGFDLVATAVEKAFNRIGKIADKFVEFLDMATNLDGIVNRFNASFGGAAQETYEKISYWSEQSGINAQEFMSTASLYASQLRGMGVAMKDAGTMAMGYTELSYDIWARFNDQYESIEQVQSSMQSLIAGFRRTGYTMGVDISTAGLEATAKNHKITGSINNMTQAQKEYLRYLTITDAMLTNGTVGTYANEMRTAEGMVRTLSQQVKTLGQTIGKVLIPIAVKVVPLLTAIAQIIGEIVVKIARLFGYQIPELTFNSGGLEDAGNSFRDSMSDAEKSAKKIKDYTMGFDELNVINPDTGSGTGSINFGGALGGIGEVWKLDIFDNVENQITKIREKLESLKPILIAVGMLLVGAFATAKLVSFGTALEKVVIIFGTTATAVLKVFAGVSLLVAGLGLVAYGIYDLIALKDNAFDRFKYIAAGIGLISTAIAILTGTWIPLLVGGIVAAGRLIVGYVIEHFDELSNAWNTWLGERLKYFEEFLNEIVGGVNWAVTKINDIFGTQLKTLDKFTFASQFIAKFENRGIDARANGGFVNEGQLFIARERGAEMVGSIGNRTAVANNDQIVTAISQGVYSAVLSAMSNQNSGSEQSLNVYLDGKQITASVEKHIKSRGATLMGSQVYNYG